LRESAAQLREKRRILKALGKTEEEAAGIKEWIEMFRGQA
jgi:hypothetical protein